MYALEEYKTLGASESSQLACSGKMLGKSHTRLLAAIVPVNFLLFYELIVTALRLPKVTFQTSVTCMF